MACGKLHLPVDFLMVRDCVHPSFFMALFLSSSHFGLLEHPNSLLEEFSFQACPIHIVMHLFPVVFSLYCMGVWFGYVL